MARRKRVNNEGSIYKTKDGRWRAAVFVGKGRERQDKAQEIHCRDAARSL